MKHGIKSFKTATDHYQRVFKTYKVRKLGDRCFLLARSYDKVWKKWDGQLIGVLALAIFGCFEKIRRELERE
jgi:hypothetical protein